MKEKTSLAALRGQFPRPGEVTWMSLRPERKRPPLAQTRLTLLEREGIEGDHYAGRSGRRQVTLISQAHLRAVADFMGREAIDPALVRRNIVVSGINLLALKQTRFRLGSAVLEYTDECHPCSRMELALGAGGYNAMRGHGGICASVVAGGTVVVGDQLLVTASLE